jgi:hypothetical protein
MFLLRYHVEARGVVDEERVRGSAVLQCTEAFALSDNRDNWFDGNTTRNVIATPLPSRRVLFASDRSTVQ